MQNNDLIKLFSYLKDFAKLEERRTRKYNIRDVDFYFDFNKLNSENNYIEFDMSPEILSNNDAILSISRPDIIECPEPSSGLQAWIISDWNDPNVKELELVENIDGETFSNTKYAHEYNKWIVKRESWLDEMLLINEAREMFDEFYRFYQQTNLLQDTHELYFGSQFLRSQDGTVDFPFVMRVAKITYDIDTKELKLIAAEEGTKIQRSLLDQLENLDLSDFKDINQNFEAIDPHPFDKEVVRKFIEPLLNSFTPFSKYLSKEDYENFEFSDEQLIIYDRNVLLFTTRSNSTVQYLEETVESIEEGYYPEHLVSFVDTKRDQNIKPAEEARGLERLANLGGESLDVLLAKEANEEQLNIIRRLQQGHDGVLVQGPPGTGKTHTIANITGHFLSEGKTVLITSKSHKALSVLKDKLPEPIQALAVSLIEDDQEDMERSIDKINEKVSSTNILSLEKKIARLTEHRETLMEELGSYRQKILSIKVEESEPVVVSGKSMSLTELAKFISSNESTLNIIPGRVEKSSEIPLSYEELEELYLTNSSISSDEEKEFVLGLVNPSKILKPEEVESIWKAQEKIHESLLNISKSTHEDYEFSEENLKVRIRRRGYPFLISEFDESIEYEMDLFLQRLENLPTWSKEAIIAGDKSGNYLKIWSDLKESIIKAYNKESEYVDKLFSKQFKYSGELTNHELAITLSDMKDKFGGIGFSLAKTLNRKYKDVLNNFSINGSLLNSKEDIQTAYYYIDLIEQENELKNYWESLIGDYESIEAAYNTLDDIDYYLTWTKNYDDFMDKLNNGGINTSYLFNYDKLKTREQRLDAALIDMNKLGKCLHNIMKSILHLRKYKPLLDNTLICLENDIGSTYNSKLIEAINDKNLVDYTELYEEISKTYQKNLTANRREELLGQLQEKAPAWALAIRERKGIHGENNVHPNIKEAWKFKQYSAIIDEVLSYDYHGLLENSYYASQRFREVTAELAAEKAWYSLIMRTKEDRELQRTLRNWQMYMAKIGKGTGKRAARYRKHARELMKDAQKAIPTWIMPMDQVMNNMTPGKNKFDVVIVDEASQANTTDLGSLFLGDKVIVVGDDRQVSPTSFISDHEIQGLQKTYFEESEMKQFGLFDGETSLYDLAGTVYEPLMLKEHFRCVPEIIDFSSFDSYDGQISALRGSNTAQVFPALAEYRVENGQYDSQTKTNEAEAKAIGALIYGMTQTKEYDGLTVGVITMISSNRQEQLILNEISKHISTDEMEKRRIVVGRSSSFQGDERDVMLLSLIHSNETDTPLRLHGPGVNNSRKKIYNVAVSRARDQLWVVHSLDPQKDLQQADYRRKLIEHVRNPYFNEDKIDSLSDSPFEKEVAMALIGRGYKIEQQKRVGTFRIDMVAYGDKHQVAIECDGERYHSGQEKIMEDLVRQTVLERIGWKFIRLRGSEYYRDKKAAVDRVCEDLKELGVEPAGRDTSYFNATDKFYTEELDSVLNHASKKLNETLDSLKKKSLPFYNPTVDKKSAIASKTMVQKEVENIISNNDNDSESLLDYENNQSDKKEIEVDKRDEPELKEKKDYKSDNLLSQEVKETSERELDKSSKKGSEIESIYKTDNGFYKYSQRRLTELSQNLMQTKRSISIVDHLGIVSEPGLWNTELNLVSWNSKDISYDLRKWKNDHKTVGKGVTLSKEELLKLESLIEGVI